MNKREVMLFIENGSVERVVDSSTNEEIEFLTVDFDSLEGGDCPICQTPLDDESDPAICPACGAEIDKLHPDEFNIDYDYAYEVKKAYVDTCNMAYIQSNLSLIQKANDELTIELDEDFINEGEKYHILAGEEMDWLNDCPYYVLATDFDLKKIHAWLQEHSAIEGADVFELRNDEMIKVASYQRPHLIDKDDPEFVEFQINEAGF